MGSVFLDNVDDYLAPSQACINPLFTSDRTPSDQKKDGKSADGNRPTDAAPSGAAGTVVKPRRMRVVRRKPSGASNSNTSNVGGQANNISSAPNTMEIDDLGAAPEPAAPSSAKPSLAVGVSSSSRKRPPIALSYKGQDDVPCPTNSNSTTNQEATVPKPKKATVSVADCLACSGCVTSAEAVMVQSHSISTLREYVQMTDANDAALVFTISPASLADLVRHLYGSDGDNGESGDTNGMDGISSSSPRVVLGRLTTFLHKEFGARLVIDGSYVQELSLIESAEEFCARYVASKGKAVGSAPCPGMMDTDSNATSGDYKKGHTFPLSTPSIALSATETRFLVQQKDDLANTRSTTKGIELCHEAGRDDRLDTAASSPVLTSSCPGFVCYVEKTAPAVIPNLSSAKSAMACSGALVKHMISEPPNAKVYHVAIMPCHDKKLEAGRKDLAWESAENDTVPDTDLVLTTSELLSLLSDATQKNKIPGVRDEMDIDESKESPAAIRGFLENHLATVPCGSLFEVSSKSNHVALLSSGRVESESSTAVSVGGVQMIGSGGYAEFCFRYAARKLFGFSIPDNQALPWQRVARGRGGGAVSAPSTGPVPVRRRRAARGNSASVAHSDMSEVALYQLSDGSYSLDSQSSDDQERKPVLKFATAYGFKNVQLVLLKLGKRGEASGSNSAEHTPDYFDFIEVMACPSGCLNGGGQIRDDQNVAKRETPAETRERVGLNQGIMKSIGSPCSMDNTQSDLVSKTYTDHLPSGIFGADAKKMLHTRFHVVPKLELSTGATAGVALDDTMW